VIAAPTPALDRVEPISRKFGFDRGTPLDRYYMQQFLRRHRQRIQGRVLEIGDRQFTEQFGTAVTKSDVFSYVQEPGVTIVGDLATGQNLPVEAVDCFIMTQTIQMIYDAKGALGHAIAALKPGGTLLVTASGISQISRYDMDRWGEFWRFTDRSLKTMLAEFVPESAIEVETFGNVAVAKAFLDGLSLEELPKEVLDHPDPDYQVLVAARVTKPLPPPSPAGLATMTTVPDSPLVLLYHRVADDPVDANLLAVSPTLFESQLRWLAEHTRVVPLHDLLAEAQEGRLEPNTVAITFDDGYLDNLTNALPLLERYRLPATIFITSGRIDSGREIWWDALERIFLTGHPLPDVLSLSDDQASQEWDLRTPALRWICHDQLGEILHSKPSEEIEEFIDALFAWAGLSAEARESHRFLTTDQLQRLAASPFIEIGSHSVTHSCMRPLSAERQRQELLDSKHQLERVIGKPLVVARAAVA